LLAPPQLYSHHQARQTQVGAVAARTGAAVGILCTITSKRCCALSCVWVQLLSKMGIKLMRHLIFLKFAS